MPDEEEAVGAGAAERPPIPSALQPANEPDTTPLPALSMIVLSIVSLTLVTFRLMLTIGS
jgi:hypothetical protein